MMLTSSSTKSVFSGGVSGGSCSGVVFSGVVSSGVVSSGVVSSGVVSSGVVSSGVVSSGVVSSGVVSSGVVFSGVVAAGVVCAGVVVAGVVSEFPGRNFEIISQDVIRQGSNNAATSKKMIDFFIAVFSLLLSFRVENVIFRVSKSKDFGKCRIRQARWADLLSKRHLPPWRRQSAFVLPRRWDADKVWSGATAS